jgi:hypothetical protein
VFAAIPVQTIACQKCQPERKCVMLASPTLTQYCDTSLALEMPTLEMTIGQLQSQCRQETQRFTNRQPYDPRFCWELLRRALTNNDAQAWYEIYYNYQDQVSKWVQMQLSFTVSNSELQTLVDDTFLKWHGTFKRTPEKFADYPTLAALLGLLRLCAERVVQDFVGKRQRETILLPLAMPDADDGREVLYNARRPLADPLIDPLSLLCSRAQADEKLYAFLQTLLRDKKEWLVMITLFLEGWKPRELYDAYPALFASIDEVNTIRERLKARLARNEQFRQQLQNISEN